MGQRPVKTQDAPGFILNYFLVPFNNDAIRLVEEGVAEPAEIDKAIKGALGYAMGPMELLDLIGLDTQLLLRSEEHTSELQSLMRISYAVFCLQKHKKKHIK